MSSPWIYLILLSLHTVILKALFWLLNLLVVRPEFKNPLLDYVDFNVFQLLSLYISLILIARLVLTLFSHKLWPKCSFKKDPHLGKWLTFQG